MQTRNFTSNERGFALAMTLFTMAMLTGLTATAFKLSQTDMQVGRNYRSAAQGLYAAEAGIRHAITLINNTYAVDLKTGVIDRWPNGMAPFESSTSSPNLKAMARQSNFAYQVTIAQDPYYPADPLLPRDRNRAVLTSVGTGSDDTARSVSVRIVRSGVPSTQPGAIYLATDSQTDATFRGNAFLIDGNDKYDGVPGPKPAVPGITARTAANAQETRDSLSDAQKDNIRGLGYAAEPLTPSVAAHPGPSAAQISQMIEDLLSRPGVDTTTCQASDGNLNGNISFGTVAAPSITYCNNASRTTIRGTGNASGAGILIVERGLSIEGTLDFKGLILVRGSTEVTEITGNAYLQGSLWSTHFNVGFGGSAVVQYSSQALEIANQSGGGNVLPQDVVVTAWRDSF